MKARRLLRSGLALAILASVNLSGPISNAYAQSLINSSQDLMEIRNNLSNSEGRLFRNFVVQLIETSSLEEAERTAKTVEVLSQFPEALTWLSSKESVKNIVRKSGLNEISDEMIDSVDTSAFQEQIKEEVLKQLYQYQGLLTSEIAGTDLEILSEYLPLVESQIQGFSGEQVNSQLVGAAVAEGFKQAPIEKRRELLAQVLKEKDVLELTNKLNNAIDTLDFSQNEAIAKLSGDQAFEVKDPKMQELVSKVIPLYFKNISLQDKRSMLMNYLSLPSDAGIEKKIASVLTVSGPIIQKIFQLVGDFVSEPLIKDAVRELKSSIKPYPASIMRDVVKRNLSKDPAEVFSDFNYDALASGTIAQVHLATLKSSGEKVIVKVRRPGVKDRAEREIETLKNMVKGLDNEKKFNVFFDKTKEILDEEMNLKLEKDSIEIGKVYVKPKKNIDIARSIEEVPPTEELLVLQLAQGKPMAKFETREDELRTLLIRGEALKTLSTVWANEALFKSGFFHGDLHSGNIFLKVLPEKKPKNAFEITLIDFGNVGRLTLEQRQGFIDIQIGVFKKKSKLVVSALERISKEEISGEKRDQLNDILNTAFNSGEDMKEQMNMIMENSSQIKIKIPKELLSFFRAKSFLEVQIKKINEALDNVDPQKKFKRFDFNKAIVKAATNRILRQTVIPTRRSKKVINVRKAVQLGTGGNKARKEKEAKEALLNN